MQSNQKNWSMSKVLIVSAIAGVVILLLLKLLLGFAFWASFFWGIVIGALVFAVLMLGFLEEPREESTGTARDAHTGAATPTTPVPAAAAKPAPKPAAAAAPPAAAAAPKPAPKPASKPAPTPPAATPAPAAPAPAAAASGTAADAPGTKPATLTAPRAGKADDLKQIKGIGPKMEQVCNALGFYHFDQIAAWTPNEVAWVDQNLEGFKGRVTRDTWVEQAKLLAAGGETEFSKKVGKGGVY